MDEYKKLLTDARNKRQVLTDHRNALMKQVEETDRQILGLNQAVEAYEFILKESPSVIGVSLDPATMGLTEAVRKIFGGTLRQLFPTDIRDKLTEAGYEKTSSKALLIHVHNVIDRLLEGEEIEAVEIEGKSAYLRRASGIVPWPPPPPGLGGFPPVQPLTRLAGKVRTAKLNAF